MLTFITELGFLSAVLIIGSVLMVTLISIKALYEILCYLRDAFIKLAAWVANRINLRQDIVDRINAVYADIHQRELEEARRLLDLEVRSKEKES